MGKHRHSSSRSRSRSPSHSRSRSRSPGDSAAQSVRLHIADLPSDISKRELEKAFERFGPLVEVWMARTVPCFGFVVFEHKEDAAEALESMNDQILAGNRIRVTFALPRVQERGRRPALYNDFRCYQCGERGHFSRDCHSSGRYRTRISPPQRRRYSRSPVAYSRNERRRSRSFTPSERRNRRRSINQQNSSDEERRSRRRVDSDPKRSKRVSRHEEEGEIYDRD